ncbi:MAG: aminotransferase class I/II-fold pyridoxal phosphate-dependent enzyme [Acidobacteria bacterium]|nr:aminotransferase class I/II-fold pyridoxal phosphate-dependent enzyme [Acidobacteriota bacterium]
MAQVVVNLLSDTVTRPTPAMRRAMAEAEVGDDGFGEDPTVNALQERVAKMFGMRAALFVPSGTMGNQVALHVLTRPGDEVIVEERAHLVLHEVGAAAVLSHVVLRCLRGARGVLDPGEVAATIRAPSPMFSHTALVCLENTHQASGGCVWPLESLRAVSRVARERGCAVYLDGARIFNASVASGVPLSEYAAEADALSFCFSKGLGAPVGSMLVGSGEMIASARKARRRFGGGMRQVGVLAAAAGVALDEMVERLAEDHANARRLAEGFASALAGCVDAAAVETNIVYADLGALDAVEVAARMAARGVRVYPYGPHLLRCVTHYEVDAEGVARAIEAFGEAVRGK